MSSLPTSITTNVAGLAFDSDQRLYIMAIANQAAVLPVANVVQPTPGGGIDVFLMKIDFSPPAIASVSPTTLVASNSALTNLTVTGTSFASTGGRLQFTGPTGAVSSSASHPERVVSVSATQWVYKFSSGGLAGV